MQETSITVNNARDLIARILGHPQGGVEGLLRFFDDQENEWLEFKAALCPLNNIFNDRENYDDYRWHVAKAVIALANSVGGAVILGIDNNACPIGLEASDAVGVLKDKGREAFNREVLQAALVRKAWSTGRGIKYSISSDYPMERLLQLRDDNYQGKPVTVILVRPAPCDELLEVRENFNNRERFIIFARDQGAIGRVREIQSRKEVKAHEQNRAQSLRDLIYKESWERFITTLLPTPEIAAYNLDGSALDAHIAKYYSRVLNRPEISRLEAIFTPLDIEETSPTGIVNVFEPQAEEIVNYFDTDSLWTDANDKESTENGLKEDCEVTFLAEVGTKREPRCGGVFELLSQEPRAILLGEPGSGKTTCLQRLALQAAKTYRPGTSLTLFVPLSQYTEKGLSALISQAAHQLSRNNIEQLLSENRLCLLLDAFNECPTRLQSECCQDISGLLRDYPKLNLVISSRVTTYRCHFMLPVFTVRPLNREQQRSFLTVYLQDKEQANRILRTLSQQSGGDLIASNPLLLRMIVEVTKKHGDTPMSRAKLYRQFMENWYEREQHKDNKTGTCLPWTLFETIRALERVKKSSLEYIQYFLVENIYSLSATDWVPVKVVSA